MALITDIFSVYDPFFLIDESISKSLNLLISPDEELYKIRVLDGSRCISKDSFMKESFENFNFPEYFGFNWDAFFDSFSEFLYDIEQTHFLLAFSNADQLFTKDTPDEIEGLIEYLGMCVKEVQHEAYNMDFKVAFIVKDATNSHLGPFLTGNGYGSKVIRTVVDQKAE